MIGKKLIEVLNKMNGVEKRAFTKFLAAPYYNQRPELIQFWDILIREKGRSLVPKKLFTLLYPDRVYDEKQLRHLSSWMLKKMERFFVVRKEEKDEFSTTLTLAKVYRDKKQAALFEQHLTKAKDTLVKQKLSPDRFLKAYQLEFEQYAYIESNKRTAANNLQGLNDSLDEYLLSLIHISEPTRPY